jgi:GTP cyclohydrolase-4
MDKYKDVQGGKPVHLLNVERVGVRNVRVPLTVRRGDDVFNLSVNLNVFVDLPSWRKGADMSRTIESINSVINGHKNEDAIEHVSMEICKECLRRFDYSSKAMVEMSTVIFLNRNASGGSESLVPYEVRVNSELERNGASKTSLSVEIMVINACPCAMETARTILKERIPEASDILDKIPVITHNQRNHIVIKIEYTGSLDIEIKNIIEFVEKRMNGSLLPLLKRSDEGEMVVRAHLNPMFVEDIVRDISFNIVRNFSEIQDDVKLTVSSESEESIHPHNAFAEISSTFGQIRKENNN